LDYLDFSGKAKLTKWGFVRWGFAGKLLYLADCGLSKLQLQVQLQVH